ncbi:MAG TPA: hypothetical protein VFN79_13450 [Steroidobacteraceae bacterium]|nr:hypothetical protein [Steroidobacteraceae bacterium]
MGQLVDGEWRRGRSLIHYYGNHRQINPGGIVPIRPVLDFTAPHGRGE